MSIKIALDRIIPLTEARARLSEIIDKTTGDEFWVLTRRGKPEVAMVDVDYLEQLMRRAQFDELTARSHAAFEQYLQAQGIDPDTASDDEIQQILQGE
jgi:prevent-host-death family protein